MPREKVIVASIIAEARSLGWWARKIHGNAFQKGLPDVLCLRNGIAVWIEAKQPSNKPTEIQRAVMDELWKHGGSPAFVITNKDQVRQALALGYEAARRRVEEKGSAGPMVPVRG